MTEFFSFSFRDGAVAVNIPSWAELIRSVEERLQRGDGFSLATINLDHLVKLRSSPEFLEAYQAHTFVVADGNPIVWLSRLAGKPVELVPGSELVVPLAKTAARAGAPVALLGSTAETLAASGRFLAEVAPGLEIVAQLPPSGRFDPYSAEADRLIEELGKSGAQFCFLALGAPRQELFAARAQRALPNVGFASIGAGLDFLAGNQRRAPKWVRATAMEWFWRLASNPRRLAMRYVRCLVILPQMVPQALAQRTAAA
jgi:N-acetylglucosaminyldiphosphoundecaprenol N-acetyl-beta-D-mannosaminyltransferase